MMTQRGEALSRAGIAGQKPESFGWLRPKAPWQAAGMANLQSLF